MGVVSVYLDIGRFNESKYRKCFMYLIFFENEINCFEVVVSFGNIVGRKILLSC